MAAIKKGSVVVRRSQITASWLTATLRAASHLERGKVAKLSVKRWRSKALSDLYRLKATYARRVPLPGSFILKVARADEVTSVADHRRWKEYEFYTQLAPMMADPPVPRPYAAMYDPATRHSHLLLEDLTRSHRAPPAPLPPAAEHLGEAMDCLAQIHAWWWNHADLGAATAERDDAWIEARTAGTRQRLTRFLDQFGADLPRSMRSALETAAAAWPTIMGRSTAKPLTIVHGDAHPWNILTPLTPGTGRPCLLDWEGWSIEPGPHDLASMIALHLPVRERQAIERELVERYSTQLSRHGVVDYSPTACWDDYRRAIVRRVLSPVGLWSRGTDVRSWWPALEHITAAYHDLDCERVL